MGNRKDEEVEVVEAARPFSHIVSQLAEGDLDATATELLRDLVHHTHLQAKVRARPLQATLTLKIALQVDQNGIVHIAYDLQDKRPKVATTPGVMFATASGNLVRDNPAQLKFGGLRQVEAPPKVRFVGEAGVVHSGEGQE